MTIIQRILYTLFLSIVTSAIVGLAITLGVAFKFLPETSLDLFLSQYHLLPLSILAFLVAPTISQKLPIAWPTANSQPQKNRNKNKFALSQILIVIAGMVLILIAQLIVYFAD